jgi:hypothetical protein
VLARERPEDGFSGESWGGHARRERLPQAGLRGSHRRWAARHSLSGSTQRATARHVTTPTPDRYFSTDYRRAPLASSNKRSHLGGRLMFATCYRVSEASLGGTMRSKICFVAASLVLVTQAWVHPAAIAQSSSSGQSGQSTADKTADKTKAAAEATAKGAKAGGEATATGTKKAATATAEGTKTAAKATESGAKTAGSATVEGTKKAGSATATGTKKAGEATAEGAEKVGSSASKGAKAVGKALTGKSDKEKDSKE